MKLEKYSIGIGDRFAHQGTAQLKALTLAREQGIHLTPVWNKSNREHHIIGSHPMHTYEAAREAILDSEWQGDYFIDADHIRLDTVDPFIHYSNFFTIDVADAIGKTPDKKIVDPFLKLARQLPSTLKIEGLPPVSVNKAVLSRMAVQYLAAIDQAHQIYQHIHQQKGGQPFIVEISMDEVAMPQKPADMVFILFMCAYYNIPINTIAPKFSGRFNKGIDYQGHLRQFAVEYEQHLMALQYGVQHLGLPADLKLSIHSGSDKFSLYPIIRELSQKHQKGFHLKTAGTTWLEELIGLAASGPKGTQIVYSIYKKALENIDALCAPYTTVIDIQKDQLPTVDMVKDWKGSDWENAIRHIPNHPQFDANIRQLLHVGYKIAAEMGSEFTDALQNHQAVIAEQVTANLWERHIQPLFLD